MTTKSGWIDASLPAPEPTPDEQLAALTLDDAAIPELPAYVPVPEPLQMICVACAEKIDLKAPYVVDPDDWLDGTVQYHVECWRKTE